MIALVNFDLNVFSELVDKLRESNIKRDTTIAELRESNIKRDTTIAKHETTIAELRESNTKVLNNLKRRNARSTLRDLLAKYSEVEMSQSLTSFSHLARQIYGVPMQSQLQRSSNSRKGKAKLWQASQYAAITAAKSAPFATEFKTLFTDPNVNQLNVEAHPASRGINPCKLRLTADHFLEVIDPDLKVIKVIFTFAFIHIL